MPLHGARKVNAATVPAVNPAGVLIEVETVRGYCGKTQTASSRYHANAGSATTLRWITGMVSIGVAVHMREVYDELELTG